MTQLQFRQYTAFIIEIDTDRANDTKVTYSPNFSFGNGTTTASVSTATAPAVGLTGGSSIYGGNGVKDTYVYTYTPAIHGDNHTFVAGTALNKNGDVASGIVAGGTSVYRVYAAWPSSTNVSGGPTSYTLTDGVSDLFNVSFDQKQAGSGNEWVFLGSALLDQSKEYRLIQQAGDSSFVSMRASGAMFDATAVPEPSGIVFATLGSALLFARRRRV